MKACFARGVKRYDFPDRKGASKIFTHKLYDLITLANLDNELIAVRQANSGFAASWELVRLWTEESRYCAWTKDDTEAILHAIIEKKDGVLPWIKQSW